MIEVKVNRMPKWYMILAIVLLLWNLMGVGSFVQHIMISNSAEALAALPEEEATLYGKYPLWTHIAFAVSVIFGVLGCLGLLLKKKWSKPVFVISFVSIVIQMYHSLFIAKATDVYGPGAVTMPILVILVGLFLIWMADYGIKKGFLH
ncbi:hypothetical protein [Namhaeicola litoreus]|uniref:Sugar transporter n=1 Tax=Namhaeicola litoreus TaxID=1052145 RepID=A0ABW3Y443_9FLAO